MNLRQMMSQLDEELNINSDDSVFDYRYYYDLIIQTLEVDLRNEYNRLRTFNDFVIQTLPCVELELVNSSTCCGEVIEGCELLRTVLPLPTLIEFHQQSGIRAIKPNNILGKNIPLISPDRIPYIKPDGINNSAIYAFIWNKHLYIYSLNKKALLMDSVTIRGLFVDPIKASEFGCGANACLTDDDEFPMAMWMWESLTKPKIMQKLLAKQFMPKDEQNNAKDDKTDIPTKK